MQRRKETNQLSQTTNQFPLERLVKQRQNWQGNSACSAFNFTNALVSLTLNGPYIVFSILIRHFDKDKKTHWNSILLRYELVHPVLAYLTTGWEVLSHVFCDRHELSEKL